MFHALGDTVDPLERKTVSANIFTASRDRHGRLEEKDIEEGV